MIQLVLLLRHLPESIKFPLRLIRNTPFWCASIYESFIAPFIAFRLSLLLWPFYKFFKAKNYCFITHISVGVGHMMSETDNFLRKRRLKEIDPEKKYILICKRHFTTTPFVNMYAHHFHALIASSFLYYLTLPLLMKYVLITEDCGESRMKWRPLRPEEQGPSADFWPPWPKILSKTAHLADYRAICKRRCQDPFYLPLRDFRSNESFWSAIPIDKTKKIALIHLKTSCANATGRITDPLTYRRTLEYLSDLAFQLIFVGREEMPKCFDSFKIFPYARSHLASFAHDIELFAQADLAMVGGSGIFNLANCLGIPHLYLNYWHVFRLTTSQKAIVLPSILTDAQETYLSFMQQWKLHAENENKTEHFSNCAYCVHNASEEEILEACQELLLLMEHNPPLTPLQHQFRELVRSTIYTDARIGSHFIEKYKTLLP